MNIAKQLKRRRKNRAFRTRKRVQGTAERPRITVYRTSMHIYAQMIDDENGRTICSASSVAMDGMAYGGNVEAAVKVGEELGRKAKEVSVERAGFDRGPYMYHGRVKALADALRSSGLKF